MFQYQERRVFGKDEKKDGELLDQSTSAYTWPKDKKHTHSLDEISHDLYPKVPIPAESISWSVPWDGYKPTVDAQDPDLASQKNNPYGRTGLRGKGTMWSYGPNYVSDAVITRTDPSYSGRSQVLVCSYLAPGVYNIPGDWVAKDMEASRNKAKLPASRELHQFLASIFFHNAVAQHRGLPALLKAVQESHSQEPWSLLKITPPQPNTAHDLLHAIAEGIDSYFQANGQLKYQGYCDDFR